MGPEVRCQAVSPKYQISSSEFSRLDIFGSWKLLWCLVFGAWCFCASAASPFHILNPSSYSHHISRFNLSRLAATADIPSLEAFTRALSLVFAKVPAADGAPADQYSIDHSASMAVLDPRGRMAGVVTGSAVEDPAAIAADLLALSRDMP